MSIVHRLIVASSMAIISVSTQAEQLPIGYWKQTSSNMGDCATCEVKLTRVTPQILQINGNNGWAGYPYYIQNEDSYRGVIQWETGKGGTYENTIFNTKATYEGKILSLNAQFGNINMRHTYRFK